MLLSCLGAAHGHGSLVIPQVRNSIDRLAPQWKGGYPKVPGAPVVRSGCDPFLAAQPLND